ncbi:vacuolar iron transporter homolog 3-like [Cryptomeria japonica]|uniref:vacuolar iron transporter homolog 3-like n=1 Tax=Cryptomeria japonica TaxID=3369 RepID=UPI0027DA9E85|nr:vacuolar iron transporter homolog 3-like [Cryptomeria japonica]
MESKQVTKEGEARVAEPSPASENKSVAISMPNEKEEQLKEDKESSNDSQIGQGLRAAVLGANDGLLTTASLMMGVSAVNPKFMILSGLAALIAGACSMAIGEFVSVQTQRDVEISILRKRKINKDGTEAQKPESSPFSERDALPNPLLAACSSALAFSVGAFLPLISAAFIEDYNVRVGVLAGVSSLALFMFGVVGAYFGRASLVKGGLRVLIGGWIAMSVTYGLLKLLQRTEVADDV